MGAAGHIGIQAVPHKGDGLPRQAAHRFHQLHCFGGGLAQGTGHKPGTGGDGLADSAAIGDRLRLSGAVDIGVGGEEMGAPAQVDAGLFQPFVGQCLIEAHHNKIRLFFGKGNPGFRKALPQGRYPQQIDALSRAVRLQVVNGHIPGRENILPGDRNPHAGKALHIFHWAAAGVIGEKQHLPTLFFCRGDKLGGAGQQPVAQIYGAIQIQHKQPDALQQGFILLHFGSSHRSIGRNFLINIAHLPRPVHQSTDYGTDGLL